MLPAKKKKLVVYHGNCVDGFTAGWAAWTLLGDTAEYCPSFLGPKEVFSVSGRDVIFLDCCPPPDRLLEYALSASSIVVIDHHKSTLDGLCSRPVPGNVTLHLDMNASGAALAWGYFQPLRPLPVFISYVQDRDLWRNRLPNNEEISAWIQSLPQNTFTDWGLYASRLDTFKERSECIEAGAAIRRMEVKTVAYLSQFAKKTTFLGHEVPVVNVSAGPISELLNSLCPQESFAVGWFMKEPGVFKYSLRSKGSCDVSLLCTPFGGGGHRNASGFTHHSPPWELQEAPRP